MQHSVRAQKDLLFGEREREREFLFFCAEYSHCIFSSVVKAYYQHNPFNKSWVKQNNRVTYTKTLPNIVETLRAIVTFYYSQ